jgi:hypothetical protein
MMIARSAPAPLELLPLAALSPPSALLASALLAPVLLLASVSPAVAADEPYVLLEQADGAAAPDGQTRVEVAGIQGTLYLRAGAPGELRFSARSLTNRREERAVALWVVDDVLRFEPPAEHSGEPLLLEVGVPPEMSVHVEAAASHVTLSSLEGPATVEGSELEVEVRGVKGAVELELDDSKLLVAGAEDDLSLRGTGIDGKVTYVTGFVSVAVRESKLELVEIDGDTDIDLADTSFVIDSMTEMLRLVAVGGEVGALNLRKGLQMELEGAKLELMQVSGPMEVDTDGSVEFRDLDGDLVVHSFGGLVRGIGNAGSLRIDSSDAEVRLENVTGSTRIEGDRLKVSLESMQGDVGVSVTASEVRIQNSKGAVDVSNDYGDVVVKSAQKKVKIASRDGNVLVEELEAPVEIQADGERVMVSWSQVARDENCVIANDGGEVWLTFPTKWGGTVDAVSEYGQVESEIPAVVVSDDGSKAYGTVRRMAQPRIQVKSGGDLYLRGTAPGEGG